MKLANIFIIIILFVSSCSHNEIIKDNGKSQTKKENITETEKISLGWSDLDTYTVKIYSDNLEKAVDKAKHQILQDIVKVRMLNESRFTDITKINAEFEKPLKNGKIISEKKSGNGVEIFFQIKDEGLKQKFEKK